MAVLFVSDVHLDAASPEAVRRFVDFLSGPAAHAEELYILGDLFEAWIGDDADEPGLEPVVDALAGLRRANVPCAFMHGNRDFLIGPRFAAAAGCRLLGDFELIDVHGRAVLLTHGDLLCTDDTRYMMLREKVRDPGWQREFLAKSIDERRSIARELRALSKTETAAKPDDIMDVNQTAVEDAMRRFGVLHLVHGHTHRPAVHRFSLDGAPAARIVLGAWYEEARIVHWDAGGFRLETLPLPR